MSRNRRLSRQWDWRALAAGVVIISALVLLVGLGSRPFLDYDEAIYARVTHDTQASGDVLILSRAGAPFFEKPPLYFWSSMALDSVLHSPEWSYRLTAAIAGLVCIIVTMALTLEVSSSGVAAVLAGIILLTTGAFVEASREVRLDIPVTACILLASYCFARGRRDPRWLVGIGVAVAVGILFKIVIALLAGVFILCWSFVQRDFGWLKQRYVWFGAGAGLLVLAPWHVYETLRFGSTFWDGYLWHNVVHRVEGDILGGSLSLVNFGKYLLIFTAPWSVVFVAVVGGLATYGDPRRWSSEQRALGVFVATTLIIAAGFAASSTRIFYYLLPAYPFMAIAIALAADDLRRRIPGGVFVALLGGLLCLGVWSTNGVAGHQFAAMAINDAIAVDEANAARVLAANPTPELVLTYQWPYWDTLGYYSGGRTIRAIADGEVVAQSYYLVVHSEGNYSYPPSYKARLTPMYQGPALTLYKFTY